MTMEKPNEAPKIYLLAQFVIALGIILGAFLLGYQIKNIGSGKSSVQIKGLAEKPVKSDTAQWDLSATAKGKTFAEALAKLRKNKLELTQLIEKQGFSKDTFKELGESVVPNFIEQEIGNGRTKQVQDGYRASQTISINSKNLELISKSYKAMIDYQAEGRELSYSSPNYLVSNLEEIKISLISAATENARNRAREFIKNSDSELGPMRSASQGAFYILSDSGDQDTDSYGGKYDKSTIDKIARVVVTVEFNLK